MMMMMLMYKLLRKKINEEKDIFICLINLVIYKI